MILTPKDINRFWSKVHKTDSCWNWTGARGHQRGVPAYGQLKLNGRPVKAHRISYVLAGGTLVDGMHIDHLCRNTGCVNPAHLEQVTPRENVRRGINPAADNARKAHCKHGHRYTDDNTLLKHRADGRQERVCLTCRPKNTELAS
jgi:hypothetical protein